jgi:hypothetical protein
MPYKFNNGESAYTCIRCLDIISTGWRAVDMREHERDTGEPVICSACTEKEEDLDPNDQLFDAYRDHEMEET